MTNERFVSSLQRVSDTDYRHHEAVLEFAAEYMEDAAIGWRTGMSDYGRRNELWCLSNVHDMCIQLAALDATRHFVRA